MEIKIEKRCGYFSPSGSEILSNGCIKFTTFIPGGNWANVTDPAAVVAAILDNPAETAGEWNRGHYIESVNSWLKKINRPDLQIAIQYHVFSEKIIYEPHSCENCKKIWTEKIFIPDPEDKFWGNGAAAPQNVNYYTQYVEAPYHGEPKTKICAECNNLNIARENLIGKIIIISATGYQRGFGSARFKYVAGLTRTEREHVKNGTAVVLIKSRPAHGKSGTIYRTVNWNRFGYSPRVPGREILEKI